MTSEGLVDLALWYVVHTGPRQEDRAESNLRAWQVETFTPRFLERHCNAYSGKPSYVIKPLFPRYIFARFKANDMLSKVRFTRGVHSVVACGETPAPVDDDVITILRARVGKDGFVKLGDDLKLGDEVMIKEGALKSFRGIFEREMRDVDRVMILLKTVSYQVHVVVARAMVKKADAKNGN